MSIGNTATTQILAPPAPDVNEAMRDVCNLVVSPAAQYDDAARDGQPLTDVQRLAICEETLSAIDTRVRRLMGWLPSLLFATALLWGGASWAGDKFDSAKLCGPRPSTPASRHIHCAPSNGESAAQGADWVCVRDPRGTEWKWIPTCLSPNEPK